MPEKSKLLKLVEDAKKSLKKIEKLTEEDVWSKHGPLIWEAEKFEGNPSFNPIYRYKNFYSYSFIALIFWKGCLRINPSHAKTVSSKDWLYFSSNDTIDREVKRIGGPLKPLFKIKDREEFTLRMAEAMTTDVASIEKKNPGYTNIILCGGKDSLNLLLLPWKNPVLVASAPPNYELVKSFIRKNGLNYDIVPLHDTDKQQLKTEILINACRNDLEHCRWGSDLIKLSERYRHQVIFWKGQLGDTFLTPYWKRYYPHKDSLLKSFLIKSRPFNRRLGNVNEKSGLAQRFFFNALWYRGAMWQGAHASLIRQLTDSLVVSGYHGPAVQRALEEVELERAVQEDVRPLIGKHLLGKTVLYPSTNPGPEPSAIRKGVSHLEPFLKILKSMPVTVEYT